MSSPSTAVSLNLLDLSGPDAPSRTGSLLEIGCGTGVIAVSAALAGCERVVATDINPSAVRNAAANAARHGVAGQVRTVLSDLFAGLDAQDRFDTVFWHSNYVLAPERYEYRDMHERGYVDPGYAAHRRFLAEAPDRLTPNGSALLHFSSRGDQARLRREAAACGRGLRLLRSVMDREGEHEIEHMLLNVTTTPTR
ncbi:50S ribosomal protein L11 methyltransferase [Streptomyces sp. H27-D2]|uniref:50S ribosomal protein L11 methyltransferase n=1 Tax=Streptomyces sp. H27-D2 TaxID=3046304 RepID=UPI002DB79D82|nr:50S ribosomal protein L11 methyltransferase [Streptomyces sp. H27-D2]MEC4019639.1 50S ribosomal protein L11 methyltransferase [Streptomyces sp. H27-D2]